MTFDPRKIFVEKNRRFTNSAVSIAIGTTEGEAFDYETLDFVASQYEFDLGEDGFALYMHLIADTVLMLTMLSEVCGEDPHNVWHTVTEVKENLAPEFPQSDEDL